MGKFTGYQCALCATRYEPEEVQYLCPKDGANLNVVFDYTAISRTVRMDDITASHDYSMWRYLPLLPVDNPGADNTPLRAVGWTPVYRPPLLKDQLGLTDLWLKDESRNPSASFKDRASALVIARAREIGAEVVVTASTGNAGAALASMAAAVGHRAVIFAPKTAPPAKVAQLLVFGAQVILVDGNYDAAFDLSVQASQQYGWYCRNTGFNPFTAEGKKTAAFEIWESVILPNRLDRPLSVFISVGDGNIISGIHKGFKDLQEVGWCDTMPHLYAVQAEGSASVSNAFFDRQEEVQAVEANTLADSISVNLPRDGMRAVQAVRQTGGDCIVVKDDHILRAIADLGKAGIFAEPAGAAAYAGLCAAVEQGKIKSDDPVLVLNTGSGLKDTRAAMMSVAEAPVIEPNLAALDRYLSSLKE
jgi:threonine synthase